MSNSLRVWPSPGWLNAQLTGQRKRTFKFSNSSSVPRSSNIKWQTRSLTTALCSRIWCSNTVRRSGPNLIKPNSYTKWLRSSTTLFRSIYNPKWYYSSSALNFMKDKNIETTMPIATRWLNLCIHTPNFKPNNCGSLNGVICLTINAKLKNNSY